MLPPAQIKDFLKQYCHPQEGDDLKIQGHFASTLITEECRKLNESWTLLEKASKEKRDRLREAHQALLFNRQADDIEAWMDDVETQLASEDHGKDVMSVNSLLKHHQLLEEDIEKYQGKVTELHDQAATFSKQRHFMSEELMERAQAISEK
jgi:spectrin beta